MKLYLDSMLWIYYFEGHTTFGPLTQYFVNRMRFARHEFLSSYLILAEVLVIPKRDGDLFTATQYSRFFLSSAVSLLPFTTNAAERFADIRATARVKPADALHLALAASARTDGFVTTDTQLHGAHNSGHRQHLSTRRSSVERIIPL
jgi:predicted nucleic acid-binding protein